ncbi:cytochrome b [Bradyrhizobium sp. GCM10023182]|uniref:Cytochrome b n=1 Tax=Bradyrhizobium zhengyangense TaxID=2911009 RepID=A0ABS9LMG3_9BRAD|nr:cytochrome b [Bradyrhizobium zhengyangense]MCG2643016.1 cytochrome b [Bradyrhizobium zhengyangense]MCG2668184.1 cytochrome b [Bradyrhizobium zhengyangense]
MQLLNSDKDYGAIAQTLHWLTVVLVILAWMLGIFGDVLQKGESRQTGLAIHIAAGSAILILLVARLIWRSINPPPVSEANEFGAWLARWGDPAAAIAHYTLYALLVAVPVAGIVLQFARGNALPLLGLVAIPSPWLKDAAFAHNVKEVHELLAHALVAIAAFHAIAALIHHWVFQDRTLIRMLPHSKE